MNWFFIALIGPVLYAVANHTDKYLISKYTKGGTVGSLVIFSALFNIVAIPIILIIHPDVFNITPYSALALALNGMLPVLSVLCYFYALHKEEASYVVPLYQTIPIFGFILGYFLLGEAVTGSQLTGALVIIVGAAILSLEFEEKIRFKHEVVWLMLAASLLYAINSTLFKLIVGVGGDYWTSLFWSQVGQIAMGIILLTGVATYRSQFFAMLRQNKYSVLGLNTVSESSFVVAEAATAFAILLAPVGLVLLVNAFQPLFVFLIGIFLASFFPRISNESVARYHLIQKSLGVLLVIFGTYVIGAFL